MPNILFLEAGGASTGGTQLWDAVTFPTGVSIDTSIKPVGAYSSIKIDTSVANSRLKANLGTQNSTRQGFYFYCDALPTSERLIARLETAGAGPVGYLYLLSTGALQWRDGAGNLSYNGSTALVAGQFYRISYAVNLNSTSNNLSVKVYLNGVQEISQTGVNSDGNSNFAAFLAGTASSDDTISLYYAHIYVDDGDDLADLDDIQCAAKFPTTVNTNDWDTVGGTGAINQRPLSETDYMEQAGASQVSQNYAIQNRATGDVNINTATVVGYMGWAWAKESAVSGTPALTVNGSDHAVTLTTSPAIYRFPVTSNTYPSNAATIGMVSSGTADDTFMYECGIVVAFVPLGKLVALLFAGS